MRGWTHALIPSGSQRPLACTHAHSVASTPGTMSIQKAPTVCYALGMASSMSSGKQAWWGPHVAGVARQVPGLYWHTPREVVGIQYRQMPGPVLCQRNLPPGSYSTSLLQHLSMLDISFPKFSSLGFLGPESTLSPT